MKIKSIIAHGILSLGLLTIGVAIYHGAHSAASAAPAVAALASEAMPAEPAPSPALPAASTSPGGYLDSALSAEQRDQRAVALILLVVAAVGAARASVRRLRESHLAGWAANAVASFGVALGAAIESGQRISTGLLIQVFLVVMGAAGAWAGIKDAWTGVSKSKPS